jgi:hypothetical protein
MAQITIVVTVTIIISIALIARYVYKLPVSTPMFSSANNQSFDTAIGHFKGFTDRAKTTFMYRFVAALSLDEAKKLQKYITKIHNL